MIVPSQAFLSQDFSLTFFLFYREEVYSVNCIAGLEFKHTCEKMTTRK